MHSFNRGAASSELERELQRELQRTPESSRQGTRPHLMGASSSTLESDMDSVLAMEGAAKISNERPWGSDNVHLSDVALHVSIVLRVFKRAGHQPASNDHVEQHMTPTLAHDEVLLARLRAELGYGIHMPLLDVSWHVWRIVSLAQYWARERSLEWITLNVGQFLRLRLLENPPREPLPMAIVRA